jgi:hypothetical protein
VGETRAADIATVERSEPFRSFGWRVRLSRYLYHASFIFVFGLVATAITAALKHDAFPVALSCFFCLFQPLVHEVGGNPTVYFTPQGLSDGKKLVYPWDKVTRLERLPAKLWLIRKQETLRVYITQDPLPPLKGIRGWLREKGLTGEPRREYGCFVNSSEYIDRIVAAMEKYSGRNFH